MNPVLAGIAALVPSAGVGFLFYLAMRAVVNADRNERAALARLDAQERDAAESSHQ
ncbi:hypothetical protein [Cellulomonas fimi]|uniref:Uncharacterized protein n=1 Tax=Cellulomonas fimi TaxID=1708 RepID=A0A7Y0QHJ1_CELFI|nr:hypothetical protein [Cellulomonas fimi]NMR20340.1 hypothetical protein [Cellulomonas fimi]